jgi:hypothetical protein
MKLATLPRPRAAAGPVTAHDESSELRRTWDHLREEAQSPSERHEIDAIFSRVMP